MTPPEISPDARLKRDVVAELQWTPGIDATRIGVGVVDGAVSLSGEVSSYPERRLAEKAVQRLRGVRAIAEGIAVRNGTTEATDTDIAREAGAALARAVDVARDAVDASVRDHVVTLTGIVPWRYQRDSAVRSVRHLRGVRDVVNQIHVKPPRPTGDIKRKIDAALVRHAAVEAVRLSVTVHGGAVTLEGGVGTWAERALVEEVAWSAPGVCAVHNHLRVVD